MRPLRRSHTTKAPTLNATRLLLGVSLVVLPGCSSGKNGANAGPSTAEGGCSSYADKFCDLLQRCAPHVVSRLYGNIESCKTRLQQGCPYRFSAEGSVSAPADL